MIYIKSDRLRTTELFPSFKPVCLMLKLFISSLLPSFLQFFSACF